MDASKKVNGTRRRHRHGPESKAFAKAPNPCMDFIDADVKDGLASQRSHHRSAESHLDRSHTQVPGRHSRQRRARTASPQATAADVPQNRVP